jgi:hypothetical protein
MLHTIEDHKNHTRYTINSNLVAYFSFTVNAEGHTVTEIHFSGCEPLKLTLDTRAMQDLNNSITDHQRRSHSH